MNQIHFPEKNNKLNNMSEMMSNQLIFPLNPQNAQNNNNKNLKESNLFHFLFALFDEITKLHIRSFFFYFFQAIIVFVQLIGVNWYCYLPNVWEKSNSAFAKILVGINTIVMLDITNDPRDYPIPAFVVPLIWNLIIAILLIVTYVIFKNSGTFSKKYSIFIAIVLQVLFYIGFLPSFTTLGTILRFIPEKNGLVIFLFILYVIVIAFDIIVIIIQTRLINFCSNPTISFLTTFDGHHLSNLLVFSGITIILTNMATVFDDWFYVVSIILHVVFNSYQLFKLFEFPLVRLWTYTIFSAFYCASIVTDILTIVSIFNGSLTDIIKFVVPICVFVVASICFYFVFRFQINKISSLLDPKEITDDEKVRYFEGLQCKNVRQATIYLHVGLSLLKPAVLDSSLGIILSNRFNDYNLWLLTGNIASFIPCNETQLDECIEKLNKMYSKSIVNRILVKRLVKIQKNRALVSTGDIEDKIVSIKMKTDDSINEIKQFWQKIESKDDRINDSLIGSIAASISSTKRSWNETLSMYPNESKLAVGYSNFLIECLGKFEDGIVWKIKGGHLEKGFHADLDKFFQAFVVAMPKLWKDKMVDKFGNLSKGATVDVTSHTTTSTVTAQEKLEEDMEGGVIEQCAEEMFQWPRLRMSLTKATSHYRPKGLTFFQILKYFAFLIWVVLILITLTYYSSLFYRMDTTYHRINALKDVQVALNNMRTLLFLQAMKDISTNKNQPYFYDDEIYTKYLPEKALAENDMEYNYSNFLQSFLQWSIKCVDSMNDLYQTFGESARNGEDISKSLATFLNKSAIMRVLGKTQATTSTKNAMLAILYNYDEFIKNYKPANAENLIRTEQIIKTHGLHITFSQYANTFMGDVVQQAKNESERIRKTSKTFVIVDLVLMIVVCLPLVFIPMILIAVDQRKIFNALKSVNPEGAKLASQTLFKDSDQKIDYLSSSQNSRSTKNSIILLIFAYTLLFVLAIILTAVAYVVIQKKSPYLADLIELLGYGSLRTSYIKECFSLLCLIKVAILKSADLNKIDLFYMPASQAPYILYQFTNMANENHNYFFKGKDGKKGVESISKELSKLLNKDTCDTPLSSEMMHPLYECISLDQLISTFISNSNSFLSSSNTFNSSSFVNLFHLTTCELYQKLIESDRLMTELVADTADQTEVIIVILLIISLILVLINILIIFVLEKTLMKNLKASLILIRHLPPPVVVETSKIIDILLVKKTQESEDTDDPKQIVFNTTEQPIICIGDGFIIETINKAFKKSFNFSSEQLVGKKLTSLIDQPVELEGEKTPQEQGAYRMYEKMGQMIETDEDLKCNYPVLCVCGDEEEVKTSVDVFPVHDKTDRISNFIIFIEDRKKTGKIKEKIEQTKSQSSMLMNQLIPRDVSNFFAGKEENFVFCAKSVTVVTVQIIHAADFANENSSKLDQIFASIERIAKDNKGMIKIQNLFDTLFFASGIFNQESDTSHAKLALEFAKSAKNELLEQIPEDKTESARFEIAIMSGGPLICSIDGDIYKSFEVFGSIIDDVIQLQAAAPSNSIIMTESTKSLVNNDKKDENNDAFSDDEIQNVGDSEMIPGVTVLGQNTFIL